MMGNPLTIRTVRIYGDNTGALSRIYKASPGLSHTCSLDFRSKAHALLDHCPEVKLVLEWVPGHHEIEGNDEADRMAKEGRGTVPPLPAYQSAAFVRNVCRREQRERWKTRWRDDPSQRDRSQFLAANKLEPSLTATTRLKTWKRKTFSKVFQCRTGHAFIGKYYSRFRLQDSTACQCRCRLVRTFSDTARVTQHTEIY